MGEIFSSTLRGRIEHLSADRERFIKDEIAANRPLKSGITGHARCARGYSESVLGDYIYINDLWPVNTGLVYWEWRGLRTHTTDIHVKD